MKKNKKCKNKSAEELNVTEQNPTLFDDLNSETESKVDRTLFEVHEDDEFDEFEKLLKEFIENGDKDTMPEEDETLPEEDETSPVEGRVEHGVEKPLEVQDIQMLCKSNTRDALELHFTTNRALQPRETLRIFCYDDKLTYKGMTTLYTADMADERTNRWEGLITTQYFWLKGNYTCIVMHNDLPLCKLPFYMDEQGCTLKEMSGMAPYDTESILARFDDNEEWRALSTMGGIMSLKQRAIEHLRQYLINKRLESFGLDMLDYSKNSILYGKEDSGTKDVATNFAGVLFCGHSFTYENAENLAEPRNPMDENSTEVTLGCAGVVCLHNAGALLMSDEYTIRKIKERLTGHKTLMLIGRKSEIQQLFEKQPWMKAYYPQDNWLPIEGYTVEETIHAFEKCIGQHLFEKRSLIHLIEILTDLEREGKFGYWDKDRVEQFVNEHIIPNYRKRLINMPSETDDVDMLCERYSIIGWDDIDWDSFENHEEDEFAQSMQELERMVGLDNVKEDIKSLFYTLRFKSMRRRKGLYVPEEGPHHVLFLGSPGTGKTTVAKLMGKIFHATGLLSKGDVVVADRSQIVGRYIGETEYNMRKLLAQARGNVLFIDEAYTLASARSTDKKDFGYRAIECLLTVLAQKDPDMVVILAGYEKEMNELLSINPGLPGRFSHVFRFYDYLAEELMNAAEALIARKQFELTEEARNSLQFIIREAVGSKDKNFSNVRWVEQLFTCHVEPAMAKRVMLMDMKGEAVNYALMEKEDLEKGYAHMKEQQPAPSIPKQRIGFIS